MRTSRRSLERVLIEEAERAGFRPGTERFKKYVFGTLDRIFPRTHAQREKAARKAVRTKRKEGLVKNPVTPHASQRQMNVIKAIQLYQKFHLQDPRYVDTHEYPMHKEMALIGRCDGILYTTVRKDRTESYKHLFTGKSKPLLAASFDGKQLYLLDGAYDFTERGIVDAKPRHRR